MMLRAFNCLSQSSDAKWRYISIALFFTVAALFTFGPYFIGDLREYSKFSPELKPSMDFGPENMNTHKVSATIEIVENLKRVPLIRKCEEKCIPQGSEALPRGIVSKTSNLKMHPLTGPLPENLKQPRSLLAIAVGIKQKHSVDEIVKKFLADDFAVMLFHYDEAVNEWNEFEWNEKVIHVSAAHQTKWWFAKRFLHPDIVAEYEYVFLWDEDLGVENFNPGRYKSIVRKEGLEISQPALDAPKSEVHHYITARKNKSVVHRRYYGSVGRGKICDDKSTAPPCVGWVEMMAPVFSKAAWRCSWYMIQNDFIHAWGLDIQLGYCSQGDRALKVGVVDEEYIVHMGLPTLGGSPDTKTETERKLNEQVSGAKNLSEPNRDRFLVRKRSIDEWKMFTKRWEAAAKDDLCWVDPFNQTLSEKQSYSFDQQLVQKKQILPTRRLIPKKHKRSGRIHHF